MRIQLICPAPPGSLYGNRVTALRWARILRRLGHRVRLAPGYRGEPGDLLIALHAARSADAVFAFHRRYPKRPIVVALTGTDLYRDLRRQRRPWRALAVATRLVAFQPLAARALPARLRRKLRVIYQSPEPTPRGGRRRSRKFFDVCVLGHLRTVKDPFRTALAARRLPASSRIRILQAGAAMAPGMARRARAEARRNPRYRWLTQLPRARARRLMAASRLLVLSSRMEGGANVISEAVVDGTPVVASRIPGSVGLLGAGYPGYFPAGDTAALARWLRRAETDSHFYRRLKRGCARLRARFQPARERAAWKKLLRELGRRKT